MAHAIGLGPRIGERFSQNAHSAGRSYDTILEANACMPKLFIGDWLIRIKNLVTYNAAVHIGGAGVVTNLIRPGQSARAAR